MKMISMVLSAILLFGSCGKSSEEADTPIGNGDLIGMTTEDWDVTVVNSELNYPWEIRMSSEETLIITEANGTIVMIGTDRTWRRYEVGTSKPVVHDGGSGLMGLALSTDFAQSGTAFVYYTYNGGSGLTNRIVELNFNGSSWRETRVILDGIPGHRLYNGGRLAIGPDGFLYATTGWLRDQQAPQGLNSLAGKVLRMDLNGEPAPGNPFAGSYIYSYGHRNPQGLAWNPDGRLYISEHGESGNDEINIITAGGNYGWPLIQGSAQREGMIVPYINSGNRAWAPAGIAFAGNRLVVAALATRAVYVMNEEARTLEQIFTAGERARAVLPQGDGLYIISTNTSPQATTSSGIADRLLFIHPKN
ncbi:MULTISPECIES: sorbosone dehydrogenase family protein [unclassified Sphingobacterium]|uniref:PQQ-dependent sugar dehydrogenase n=1 Tax=unclassified Sphingobacterium TaxID=2609468 RepID=UPI0025F193E9|nr:MULTISPECIES: PQQ-dependent sugar dehydrogenase [unclassified Sphingobacterium]